MKDRLAASTVPNLRSTRRISGLTHSHYRYPATTSPDLVRDIVLGHSKPGDYVLDPFMGGGTSIVESVAHGRRVIGVDLNPLAVLIARAKTTPLTEREWNELSLWAQRRDLFTTKVEGSDERAHNLPGGLTRSFASYIEHLPELSSSAQRLIARCALLSLGRWSLESRRDLPTNIALRRELTVRLSSMRRGMGALLDSARAHGVNKSQVRANRLVVCSSAEDTAARIGDRVAGQVRLVVTSPPYPGVHVLYHRWQVKGRRETAAPYWIAAKRDGSGPAYYTMGGRSEQGQETYFERLGEIFSSLRPLVAEDATVAQVVAFHNIRQQLPRYLDTMRRAGFKPRGPGGSGRLTRLVPNRKWYAQNREFDCAREFLLLHSPA